MKNLRKRYPKFIYEDYSWRISRNNLEIFFDFKVPPNISFRHKVIVKNVKKSQVKKAWDRVLDNLIFHLGLVEIPSYWKTTCSPIIVIRPGFLNKDQINFWKNLLVKGMGQFFYENKINFTKPNFLKIISTPQRPNVTVVAETSSLLPPRPALRGSAKDSVILRDRYLVPVGGGKDSIVTLERLKEREKEVNAFAVNPSRVVKDVLKVAGIKKPIVVERKIDKKLLELNKKGFLNGHIPFTAILSFLSVLTAVLFNYKNIAFSNEKSSDEGNLRYLDMIINHQWSKSSEFERKFRRYCKNYLTWGVKYSSLLRSYTELEISKMFLKYPQYFQVFSSCNQGGKTGKKWCGNCPKCLFIYASLYPYLKKKTLLKIFGRDFFENKKLLPVMKDLIGQGSHKPFECVGTFSESRKIFKLCLKRAEKFGKIPYLLARFKKTSEYAIL